MRVTVSTFTSKNTKSPVANQNKSFLYVELRLILICNVMLRPASLFLAAVPAGSESTAWRKQTKMDKRL